MKNKVTVLMSTYNGEKYLKDQIESILNQSINKNDNYELLIIIRDDGSTDDTVLILEEYAKRFPDIIRIKKGENKGVVNSFFELINSAPESDYYAFSDQDDYWLEDKLMRAVSIIEKESFVNGKRVPMLYACKPTLADKDLNIIDSEIKREGNIPGFKNALVENICVGCTEVFNNELYSIIRDRQPKHCEMHDWWLYLTASCFGKVYYDNESFIYYRQHEGNEVGMETSIIKEFIERFKRFNKNRHKLTRQMTSFLGIYGKIADGFNMEGVPTNKKGKRNLLLCRQILRKKRQGLLKDRLYLAFKTGLYRQRKTDDLIFKLILFSCSF